MSIRAPQACRPGPGAGGPTVRMTARSAPSPSLDGGWARPARRAAAAPAPASSRPQLQKTTPEAPAPFRKLRRVVIGGLQPQTCGRLSWRPPRRAVGFVFPIDRDVIQFREDSTTGLAQNPPPAASTIHDRVLFFQAGAAARCALGSTTRNIAPCGLTDVAVSRPS